MPVRSSGIAVQSIRGLVLVMAGLMGPCALAAEQPPVADPHDHNPAYVARKVVAQLQVVAPEVRLYQAPDVSSLAVGRSDRG